MFSFELTRVVIAAVGALILSTLSVTAAVGPGTYADRIDPNTTDYVLVRTA